MCNIDEYSSIYKKIKQLSPEDTLQLVMESDSEDQKDFYEMVGNYLLQKKQKEIIERNLF